MQTSIYQTNITSTACEHNRYTISYFLSAIIRESSYQLKLCPWKWPVIWGSHSLAHVYTRVLVSDSVTQWLHHITDQFEGHNFNRHGSPIMALKEMPKQVGDFL
jgi:hypothetical protein